MRSGFCKESVPVLSVWNSTTFHCAADSSPCLSTTSSSGGWPIYSAGSSCCMPGNFSVSACFWKNSSPATPVGARTSDTGRFFRWAIISSPTRS